MTRHSTLNVIIFNSEEDAAIMLANSWLYQYYGYQNQPCGVLDPRCQKFFRRETTYQDAYQEYSYVDSQEMEYPAYHVSTYVPQKMSEDINGEFFFTLL